MQKDERKRQQQSRRRRRPSETYLPAGDAATVAQLQPLFSLMGKNIKHMGGPGAGQHTKMVNQILIASNMVGVCEGLLYAHK